MSLNLMIKNLRLKKSKTLSFQLTLKIPLELLL